MAHVELEYRGIRYTTHTEVYAPHDDTWLLVDAVRALPMQGRTVLEVGCGAGLGVLAACLGGARGIGLDRNRAALVLARDNALRNDVATRFDVVHGDLLEAVDPRRVDVVLFNPPYLPTEPHERLPGDLNLAFDGGPTGNETIQRFVDTLVHWSAAGRTPELVMVTSSLNDRPGFHRDLHDAGWTRLEELGQRAFPFERLFVERFQAGA